MQQWYFLGVEGSVSDKMLLSTLTIDSDDNASCLHPNRAAQSLVLVLLMISLGLGMHAQRGYVL